MEDESHERRSSWDQLVGAEELSGGVFGSNHLAVLEERISNHEVIECVSKMWRGRREGVGKKIEREGVSV